MLGYWRAGGVFGLHTISVCWWVEGSLRMEHALKTNAFWFELKNTSKRITNPTRHFISLERLNSCAGISNGFEAIGWDSMASWWLEMTLLEFFFSFSHCCAYYNNCQWSENCSFFFNVVPKRALHSGCQPDKFTRRKGMTLTSIPLSSRTASPQIFIPRATLIIPLLRSVVKSIRRYGPGKLLTPHTENRSTIGLHNGPGNTLNLFSTSPKFNPASAG